MTFTPTDLELSPPAAARLEEYLGQVRAALAGSPDVSAGDIESDLREHVANELSAAPRPVPLAALSAVLEQLGPPAQWGAAPDPAAFRGVRHLLREHLRGARTAAAAGARRVRLTLWNGPEDWRLAYLSFGVLAVGLVTMVVFPLALLVSYVLSRAGVAHARERGIDLGAGRKWLLYPPVVLVSAPLLLATVTWPLVACIPPEVEVSQAASRVRSFEYAESHPGASTPFQPVLTLDAQQKLLVNPRTLQALQPVLTPEAQKELMDQQAEHARKMKERMAAQVEKDRALLAAIPVGPQWAPLVASAFVGCGAVALWWMILGAVGARFPDAVRATFFPLCNRFEAHHGTWLAVMCFVLLLPWLAAVREFVAALV
ncbi:hypothetical protein R5W24_002986 [Gemmata sp. JC717]|uniref:hypothetical protein n=1 Tax=Gemmata algarum TaxID=2975278 RepID=UPI0021BAE98B|nr:hypothetical protein [Gemmata algarum]MDY3553872.1 hypothetical protein [Gemmata algarum]